MGVSKKQGTPKSSFLGFSIINHPFWGAPIFGNNHMASSLSLYFPLLVDHEKRRPVHIEATWRKFGALSVVPGPQMGKGFHVGSLVFQGKPKKHKP